MNHMKRMLALLLALVMIVGVLPLSVLAAEDTATGNFEGATTSILLDAAIFCSDVHGKPSTVTSIFNGIKNADATFNPSTVSFVGDTQTTASSVTSVAQGVFPGVSCYYAFGNHDDEGNYGIKDVTGLIYGDSSTNYYIYAISENSMASSNPSTTDFTNTVAGLDKTKPLFIISHLPLHSRRGDSNGAAVWYSAISAAANEMDIFFFWAHNHTGDNAVDQAAYYVAKNGSETITLEDTTTVVTPNFTYANAGYINPPNTPARNNVATAVRIYNNSVNLTVYNASGELTGTYAVNETITREFAPATPKTLAVTGSIEYLVGDALRNPTKAVVNYTDGAIKELNVSDLKLTITTEDGADLEDGKFVKAGTYKLTYAYTENGMTATATLNVVVKDGMKTVYNYADDPMEYYVEATALGLTGITATYVYNDYIEVLADTFTEEYMAYDITLEGHTDGNEVTYYFAFDTEMALENLGLYHIDENNKLIAIPFEIVTEESGIKYIQFTTTYVGVFAYGNVVVPEGYALSHITVDNQGTTKYLVGEKFSMVGVLVSAVYTKADCEDFVATLYIKGYGVEDGYEYTWPDMTTAGTKTITVTYGDKSASFDIEVYNGAFSDANTGVSVEVTVPGATEIEVEDVTASSGTVAGAVGHLLSNYVAYDIELTGYNDGEKVTVTLPVPEGVENPVVYYVSDDGKTVQNMGATKNADGTVSFETDHFSKYVVGESTNIEVPDPTTATGTGTFTTTTKKTVYVLTNSISAGNSYLIANSNSASTTTRYLLANNNGSVAATGVTIQSGDVDGDGDTDTYIELEDATDELWAAASGLTFKNGSVYLGYTSSGGSYSFGLSTTARSWSYSNNRLSTSAGSRTYYLRYSSGWTWTSSTSGTSASGRSVYFYEKTEVEIETTTTGEGTYSIAGNPAEITKVVVNGSTATLGSTLTFTPNGSTESQVVENAAVTYTVVENGDPNGVITGINGNTVTFSGNYGKALVKVSYTPVGSSKTATNYIVVTATAPTYTLDITSGGNVVTGTTVPFKGITAGKTVQLGTKIQFVDEDGAETVELPEGATLEWNIPAEYQSIATIDQNGLLTFKGVDGAFYVTATLTVNGKDYTVGVNISATTSSYSVPSDGAADFPEYPNEGAIRFDKTATAVGNFSQTGIAQVELSMTGVPYTTGSEIDVVLMLDMTGSMDDVSSSTSKPTGYVRIDATIAASKAFISTIVKNEDGSYNGNRVGVYVFNKNGAATLFDFGTVDSDTELNAIYADLETIKDDHFASGGTPYDDGLKKCYDVLAAAKKDGIGNDRQQFTVFMTDGVPTDFEYINGTSHANYSSASTIAGMLTSASDYATRDTDYKYEYYSTEMKKAGVTVYSVGVGLFNENNAWSGSATQCGNLASALLNDISGPGGETTQPDAVGTSTLSKKDKYFFSVEDATAGTDMTKIFSDIAVSILQAATDVTVEDKITDEYTMIFDIPEGSKDITGVTNDFYIEFGKYALDDDHERTTFTSVTKLYLQNTNGVLSAKDATAPVFEQKTIGDKGTLYYWTTDSSYASDAALSYNDGTNTYYFIPYGIDAKDDGYDATKWFNMTSGAYANGKVNADTNMSTDLVIATPYFVYNASTKMIYWTVDKLDTTEYVLRYFLYLDDSATEVGTGKEVDPGSYPTNDHAYLTYTNFNGNECRQEFVKPQLTWSGAQVSYVFYLVNAQGQPINKSGQVVDFANAVFVTDVFTEDTVWNKGEDGKITADSQLSIDWLANSLLPSDYMVYDLKAQYKLHVYGDHTGTSIFDYFTIGGSTPAEISASLNSRLEGANTTASSVSATTTKVYNTKAGEKITGYGIYTSKATNDYNNEIVLDEFDFYNTTVAFAVVWQPKLVEDTVVVDFGLDVIINVVANDILQNKVTGIGSGNTVFINNNISMNDGVYNVGQTTGKLGTAALTIDGNTISIENETSIRFHQGDMEFKTPVVFYYESPVEFWEGSDKKEGFMYSSVTVIPATTIYYEDEFLTFESYAKEGNSWNKDEQSQWATAGNTLNGTQAQDRPGASQISAALDADNNYGYDAAYQSMSQYSMGSAAKITVDKDHYGLAKFTFAGTGFDVISLTSSATGSITVKVYDENGKQVRNLFVDTYYGYVRNDKGEWVATTSNDPNALYQVPVITVEGLKYGTYSVVITAAYNSAFDHQEENGKKTQYELYLDAIRIYDPTGVVSGDTTNDVVSDAYVKDGEGWPEYTELRDKIIAESKYNVTENGDGTVTVTGNNLPGAIFIDSNDENTSIADYVSYGPNNELYLANGQNGENGQSIAFVLNKNGADFAKTGFAVDKVQLAFKSVGGTGRIVIKDTDGKVYYDMDVATATDMYYDISELDGKDVIIQSTGSAIISLTNIKVTYKEQTPSKNGETPVSIKSLAPAAKTEEEETYLISVNAEMIERVLNMLNGKVEVEPERPFEPAPGKPSKPGSGNKPVAPKPSQPIKPSVPAKPIKPVRPVVPTMPVNPGLPGIPGRPAPVVAIHIY